ncbi:hypothetical protein QN224_25800 [Sinorhizobium sp. 8-89]|uniref:hypothetical protein n=1 Tax=Sinorhizobium sp. 7-81 TaxID=3049087 RepID=UPI0024C46688|nr:hypothetical protein [Sinorhizobium sp. 7-81]MDK1388821.1 hypothetical protein [Sinorhizobium sp. 7-81]
MKMVSAEQRLFAFYLEPDFTTLAFSSALDALRLANAVVGYEAYSWRVVSSDGAKVRASCGLTLEADSSVAESFAFLQVLSRDVWALAA